MEDLIPVETVLADMESDCGIVAEAAKDYLDIHHDEYRSDKRQRMKKPKLMRRVQNENN